MASQLYRYLILGAPGSGKGTISSRIISHFNLEYIPSGDRLRLHVKNQTELGRQAKKYIDAGKLVPDFLMVKFMSEEIDKIKNCSWLLDGFPRTISQCESLWTVQKLDLVINLDIPFNIIIDRIKGRWIHLASGRVYNADFNVPKILWKDDLTGEDLIQRNDDQPEIIAKRLAEYKELSTPIIKFYESVGILQTFEGSSSNEIWPKVLHCLTAHLLGKRQYII